MWSDQHPASLVAAGRLRKALQPRLAVPTYLRRFRLRQGGKIISIRPSDRFWAAASRLLAPTEVLEGERLVAYQFVTRCAHCAKQFGIIWAMDSTRQVPKTVARITCPLCGKRFYQDAKDLLETGSQIQNLAFGRPVRSVEVNYDCPYCSNRGILVSLLHTDLSWGELSKEHAQTAVCDNGLCPQRGFLQELKPSRVVLGSLNPV